MYTAQLSITDRFVELGNLFFNVKDNEREYKFDLHYENTSQDPVNRFIADNDERINDFYKFLNSILDFVVGIFAKQKTKPTQKFERTSNFGGQNAKARNNNAFKNLSSQQVIRNSVRNKLLQSIRIEEDNENRKSSNKVKSVFKLPKIKLNYFFREKEKVVVKNRFMGAKS